MVTMISSALGPKALSVSVHHRQGLTPDTTFFRFACANIWTATLFSGKGSLLYPSVAECIQSLADLGIAPASCS